MSISPPGSCSAIASPAGDDVYALRFVLSNHGDAPIALPVFEPFTAFSVMATADGKPLAVHRPTLDIAVNPATVRLPPGATATIATPIRLRIAEGAAPADYGFVWTIAHRKESVSLQVRLDLPAPFALLCPLSFRP